MPFRIVTVVLAAHFLFFMKIMLLSFAKSNEMYWLKQKKEKPAYDRNGETL